MMLAIRPMRDQALLPLLRGLRNEGDNAEADDCQLPVEQKEHQGDGYQQYQEIGSPEQGKADKHAYPFHMLA